MKVTSKFVLAAMLTVTAGVAGLKSANATTYDWNFTPGADGVLSSSVTITNGSPLLSAVATGYTDNGFTTPTPLFGKVDGGDEHGIGINSDPTSDHEIWGNTIIQVTLPTGLSNIQAKLDSTTIPETYTVWGSSTSATGGYSQLIANGTSDDTFINLSSLCPTCNFFYFGVGSSDPSGNVLLTEITAESAVSPVPLPAALPLFATGLGALGLLSWRRKKRAIAA